MCGMQSLADLGIRSVLGEKDVLKVDFGVHVKGRILDSAFTLTFDHTYDKLLEAVKAATDTGVRVCFFFNIYSGHGAYLIYVHRKQASTCAWGNWQAIFRKPWNHTRLRSTARYCQVSRLGLLVSA